MERRAGRLVVALGVALAPLLLALWMGAADAQQSEVQVLMAQAVLAYDDKRYAEALGFLQEALKLDPTNVDALYYTGVVQLAQKNTALAIESLEKARGQDPADPLIRFQLGVAYYSLGQYDKAEPLLTEVFNEQPQIENLGYYVGFMRYRNKDYQGAVRAFTAGTATDPNIQQLTRFYTGLAMGILGLPERAIVEVEEALRILPASPITGSVERLRDTIVAARERERRVSAELRFGGFYDDNVSINPRASNDPTAESLRPRKSRSPGELAAARLGYAWLRTGPWEATANYSFFQTLNNLLPNFNIQNHLGALGATYRGVLAALPYQIGTQYSYDFLTLNEAAFLQRHTATLFGTLVEDAGNLTTALGRFQGKNFLNAAATIGPFPQENRDAKNYLVGLTHVFRFAGDKHLLRLGYQFDRELAEGSNYTYSGHRILTGGQVTLPYDLPWGAPRLRYDYEAHLRYYANRNTILPASAPDTVKRKDTEHFNALRLEQPLPDGLTLSVEYLATIAKSNLAVFAFDRNVYSLILSWQY